MIILSMCFQKPSIVHKKIFAFFPSDTWIYTIDTNTWEYGPYINGYYNYIFGICGVVTTADGMLLIL